MSVSSKHNQLKKLYGITKLKSDVIMLSNIRMCNRNLVSASNDCSKVFKTNPYGSFTFLHHSSMNKRGVGILINNNIDFSVLEREEDPEENFLLLRITLRGHQAILGSVYGPNEFNPQFFDRLKRSVQKLGNLPIILGGDWNCTFSRDPIETNIDCLNMQRLPNLRHSELLDELCNDLRLTDPYRIFFPTRRDFTFKPRCRESINRSRIDFFLISIDSITEVSGCDILPGLQSSLFDHKAIVLKLNIKVDPLQGGPTISRAIINDTELDIVVKLAVAECYVVHILPAAWPPNEHEDLLNQIGRIRTQFRLAGPSSLHLPVGDMVDEDVRLRADLIDEIRDELVGINISRFEDMPLNCNQATFMEVLLNAMCYETVGFQSFIKKVKNQSIKKLLSDLTAEKKRQDANIAIVDRLEREIDAYYENELVRELEHYSLFEHVNMEKMTPHFLKLAKCTKADNKLCDIRDDNGNNFQDEEVLKEFVVSYYENLYKLPDDQKNNINGVLRIFWGQNY